MQTKEEKRAIIQKLQIGDIINVRTESWLGKAIRFCTSSNINHSAWYIGNNLVMEATIPLVCIMHVNEYTEDDSQEIYCCSVNGLSQQEKEELVNINVPRYAVGTKYDTIGLTGIAFRFMIQKYWWRLMKFMNFEGHNKVADKGKVWCSALLGVIFLQKNKKFTDDDISYLTPNQIYESNIVTKIN